MTATSLVLMTYPTQLSDDGLSRTQKTKILAAVRQLKRLNVRFNMVLSEDCVGARYLASGIRKKNLVKSKAQFRDRIDIDDIICPPEGRSLCVLVAPPTAQRFVAQLVQYQPRIEPLTMIQLVVDGGVFCLNALVQAPA